LEECVHLPTESLVEGGTSLNPWGMWVLAQEFYKPCFSSSAFHLSTDAVLAQQASCSPSPPEVASASFTEQRPDRDFWIPHQADVSKSGTAASDF